MIEVSPKLQSLVDTYLGARRSGREPLESGERNIRTSSLHGIFSSTAASMVGPFTAIFAMKIGASQLHVALLTSAPAVVSLLAMIPGARLIDRARERKLLTYRFMLANRVFYLALAVVPFFAPRSQATIFVLLLALMNLPGAISSIAWQTFIARIIPPDKRSRAFAARNRLMNVFGTATTVLTGVFLDRSRFPIGYQIAFLLAFALAAVELAVFNRIEEPKDRGEAPPAAASIETAAGARERLAWRWKIAEALAEILAQRNFVRYTLVSMLFYLAWQTPWPLFSWYLVRVLHANNVWVSVLSLLNTGGALVGYSFWQRTLDRRGNLMTLFISTSPIFLVPVVYSFSQHLWVIAGFEAFTGALFSGVNLALFNTLLEMTPENKKATYIAYYTTAVTVTSIIAPLFGVSLLRFMTFRWAFLFCAAFRLAGSLGFRLMLRDLERERRALPLSPRSPEPDPPRGQPRP